MQTISFEFQKSLAEQLLLLKRKDISPLLNRQNWQKGAQVWRENDIGEQTFSTWNTSVMSNFTRLKIKKSTPCANIFIPFFFCFLWYKNKLAMDFAC